MTPEPFRSGFAAVVGRPNVGKSTLVNGLVQTKVAITSSKPQTTRGSIRGILNDEGVQVVFVDTPGYHKPRTLLGERLNELVRSAWSSVDIVLFVVDGAAGIGRGDARVAQDVHRGDAPTFCVVNKIDRLTRDTIAVRLMEASELGDFVEYVPISAATGDGVGLLRDLVIKRMRPGPMYYPEGMDSDMPPPAFVAELVREKLLERMGDELPHSIAVVTEEFEARDDGVLEIDAVIFVERESQKGMVIGRGGGTLKAAGTEARHEIEALFGCRVFVRLRVKVEKDWQRRDHALARLGFDV
ncbi:MAG: GTPase Era [Actinobacteria bacterium]|nr:GTPase Era [Actinomycetota bacterium]